jgi:hypothetical protein
MTKTRIFLYTAKDIFKTLWWHCVTSPLDTLNHLIWPYKPKNWWLPHTPLSFRWKVFLQVRRYKRGRWSKESWPYIKQRIKFALYHRY